MEQLPKRKLNMMLPLVAVLVFLLGFESGGFQLVLTDIAAEYNLDNTAMGSLVTVQYAAILVMPLIFGGISDKIGKKKVMAIFVPVLIAGCVFVILSHSVAAFMVGIFTLGAGYSVSECIGSAALSDSDPHHAEKNMSLTQSLYSMGAVVSPLLINLLMGGGMDWRIVYILTGIGFAALYPWVCLTKFHKVSAPLAEGDRGGGFRLLRNGIFIALVVCIMLYVGLENGVAYFADYFFMVQLDYPQLSAYAIYALWLAMA